MSTNELKPCPFCGGDMEDRGYGAVHLDPQKCPIGDLAIDIKRWNCRADLAALTLSPQAEDCAHEAWEEDSAGQPIKCSDCGVNLSGTAALTPAPQANQNYADPVSSAPQAATPTAQESVPVAWQVRYHSKWIMAPSCWTDEDRANWPGEHRPLYTHPPQPSEAVAEALKLAAARLQRLALEIPSTTSLRAEAFEWADEALRALKGGDA